MRHSSPAANATAWSNRPTRGRRRLNASACVHAYCGVRVVARASVRGSASASRRAEARVFAPARSPMTGDSRSRGDVHDRRAPERRNLDAIAHSREATKERARTCITMLFTVALQFAAWGNGRVDGVERTLRRGEPRRLQAHVSRGLRSTTRRGKRSVWPVRRSRRACAWGSWLRLTYGARGPMIQRIRGPSCGRFASASMRWSGCCRLRRRLHVRIRRKAVARAGGSAA